jgi:hypothetical protein
VAEPADKPLFLFLFPDWRYRFFAHIEMTFYEKRKSTVLVECRVMVHITRTRGNSD